MTSENDVSQAKTCLQSAESDRASPAALQHLFCLLDMDAVFIFTPFVGRAVKNVVHPISNKWAVLKGCVHQLAPVAWRSLESETHREELPKSEDCANGGHRHTLGIHKDLSEGAFRVYGSECITAGEFHKVVL